MICSIPESLLRSTVPASAKLLYGYLAGLADSDGVYRGKDIPGLAADLGIGGRTVHRDLKLLVQARKLVVMRHGPQNVNGYRVLRPLACPDVPPSVARDLARLRSIRKAWGKAFGE